MPMDRIVGAGKYGMVGSRVGVKVIVGVAVRVGVFVTAGDGVAVRVGVLVAVGVDVAVGGERLASAAYKFTKPLP